MNVVPTFMSSRFYLLLVVCLFFCIACYGQEKRTIYIEDILTNAQKANGTFVVKNVTIAQRPIDGVPRRPGYRVHKLVFEDCSFDISIDSLIANSPEFRNCRVAGLAFTDVSH